MASSKGISSLWLHVHCLTVLATLGSYTTAAQRLRISKAAMSQRITELERTVGVPLVRRTTRSVQLTEAGRQLVDATRPAFARIEDAFENVRDFAEMPQGLVRVSAPVSLSRQQIVPQLPEFLDAHPRVRVELDMSDRLVALAQEGFDLAIRHSAAVPDTHVAWTICATRTVLVASKSYLRRRGMPARPEDLSTHNCLHYPRPQGVLAWHFESVDSDPSAQRVSVSVSGSFAANNSEALRDAALNGLGIALLPDFSANAALAAGELTPVLSHWRPVRAFADTIFAVRPYSSHVPRAVQELVNFLRTAFASGF